MMKKEAAPSTKRPKSRKTELPETIRLAYALAELPSAQHRAGLAGLVLTLRWMDRASANGMARIDTIDDRGAVFSFNEQGMKELFDVLYAASIEEQPSTTLRKNKRGEIVEPIRTEERTEINPKTKKETTKKVYIYPVVVPKGGVVLDVDPSARGSTGIWTKLWREALWTILRGVPAQRLPFEARAGGEQITDGAEAYHTLATAPDSAVPLPSTFFLGAMDKNAEDVPFRDRARFQFLLQFWPIVASIFTPETEDHDGKRSFWGYAFAIPDVAVLDEFCEVWPAAMAARSADVAGFRPREGVISLCKEAGLAAMSRLKSRLEVLGEPGELERMILAIDVVHADKPGNAVKITEVGRLEPRASMIDEYERVRNACWDFAFRRQSVENVLHGAPWHRGFARLLRILPSERVLGGTFAHDARIAFEARVSKNEETMTEPKEIEEIVLRLVTSFVAGRIGTRTSLSWNDVKDDPVRKREYDEAKGKAARNAFLAVRSRTGSDFIDYFAGTLCSVPQRLSNDDFATLSRALRERTEEVRTLTLLALSARS